VLGSVFGSTAIGGDGVFNFFGATINQLNGFVH